MILTERDQPLLEYLARYYLLTAGQVHRLCYSESTSRVARRRCSKLVSASYIHRYPKKHDDRKPPVYYLADKGKEWLADYYDDDRYLAKPTKLLCRSEHVPHTVAVGDFLHILYQAVAKQNDIKMLSCFHEFEPVNASGGGAKPKRLYTQLREAPRLICDPDAGMLFGRGEHRVVYYIEREMGNTGSTVVPKKKSPGYEELGARGLCREHFPSTTWDHFFVLFVCPTARWRDRFMQHAAATNSKVITRWKAIAVEDATPERLLFEPIVRQLGEENLLPLIPPQ